jgi:hypothetical protein
MTLVVVQYHTAQKLSRRFVSIEAAVFFFYQGFDRPSRPIFPTTLEK